MMQWESKSQQNNFRVTTEEYNLFKNRLEVAGFEITMKNHCVNGNCSTKLATAHCTIIPRE